jgi:Flp pilus assembly protein TadG
MRVCTALSSCNRRGSVIVEAVLLFPVFVLVCLGGFEIHRGMVVGAAVSEATQLGAREAARDGSCDADVSRTVCNRLQEALGVAKEDVSVSMTSESAGDNAVGRVVVSIPYDQVGGVAGQWMTAANVRSECVIPIR